MPNRAFIEFTNLNIIQYAEITNCFVRFTAHASDSGTPVNLRVGFVDEGNASAPNNYSELQNLSVVNWVDWTSLASWTSGGEYDTPDLIISLQPIIDRVDWSRGNSVVLIIEDVSSGDNREWSSVRYSSGNYKAELHIDYIDRSVNLYYDYFPGDGGIAPNFFKWTRESVQGYRSNQDDAGIWDDRLSVKSTGEGYIDGFITSKGQFQGGYSIEIDYLDFATDVGFFNPSAGYLDIFLRVVEDYGAGDVWSIHRIINVSYPAPGSYVMVGGDPASAASTYSFGQLRVDRVGTTLSFYYRGLVLVDPKERQFDSPSTTKRITLKRRSNPVDWVLLGTVFCSSSIDHWIEIGMTANSITSPGVGSVIMSVDNYIVTSGIIVIP